ncbi:MAG: HlyD family secretion protein, partial [Anaerolineales bacterium]
LLLFLVACQGETTVEPSVVTPTPVDEKLPTQTPMRTGVTILVDGAVQAAQPALPLGFEASGKLLVVHVRAGEQVQEGDILAELEEAESLASNQSAVASAELSVLVAQQELDDLFTNAGLRQAESLQAIAAAQQELDALAVDIPIQQSEALQAIADAEEAVRSAEYHLNSLSADASEASVTAAQSDVTLAARRLKKAEEAYEPYRNKPDTNLNKAYFGGAWADAKSIYDAAVRRLNALTGGASDLVQAQREAELAVAQAQLAQAQATYEALADGIPPADLAVAEAKLSAAQAAYDALEDGIDPDELAFAEAKLANAEIQLTAAQQNLEEAVEMQDAIYLKAPWTGTVISVDIAPGAMVGSGTPILTLLDTTQLEFHTTNLSERDLARILLGQQAVVTLKAYPNTPIDAAVIRVGWQTGEPVGDVATFPVILSLQAEDLEIRTGMTGQVEILSDN